MLGSQRTSHLLGGLLALVLVGAVCVEIATWFWTNADSCEVGQAGCDRPAVAPTEALPARIGAAGTDSETPVSRALRRPSTSSRDAEGDALRDEAGGPPDPASEDAPEDLDGEDGDGDADGDEPGVADDGEAPESAETAELTSAPDSTTPSAAQAATATPSVQSRNATSLSSVPGQSGLTTVTSRTVVTWRQGETVETWLWPWSGTQNHGVTVPRLSCDAHDAVRISEASQLYLLSDPSFRVFCLAPGDYRELGPLVISGVSGTASSPRVVQLDGDALDAALGVAESDDAALPTLPSTTLRNSDHWQFIGLHWQDDSAAPVQVVDSDDVLFDRVRIDLSDLGVSVTGSDGVALQRSLVSGSEWQHTRCAAVELADNARFAVTNTEFLGCYQALQIASSGSGQWAGVQVAGNEFHRDSGAGDDCDVSGVWLDGSVGDASDLMALDDNVFSGWTPPSACPDSAGAAIVLTDRVGNALLDRNVIWGSAAGVVIADGAGDVAIQDSVVVGDDAGHGVRVGTGTGVVELIRNHVVRTDRWLDSQRSTLTLSCNAVAESGLPSSPVGTHTLITPSSYFSALPGAVASAGGQDQVETLASHHFGALCVSTHALSDPSTQCLTGAARDPGSVVCGSDYWVAQ